MSLPLDKVKPAFNYTSPSERAYFDTPLSTVDKLQVTDPSKSGGDYGITDPKMVEPVTGMKSESGNGAKV